MLGGLKRNGGLAAAILALPLLLGTAAPAAAQSLAIEVHSIAEVTRDRAPRIVFTPGGAAELRFLSSIPLACSVIYGETTDYGLIAVDTEMAGGAHANHHPPMAGLKPDTLYHFRVQGTSANGTLYASRDLTFRTPPVKQKTQKSALNLLSPEAGARIAAVSSNFGNGANAGAWGAGSAVDGQGRTAWSSNGDGDKSFIEIELARPTRLAAVSVWTRTMSDGTAQILTFKLTTDSGKVFGPFTLADASKPYRFKIDVLAKRLRLDVVTSTGGNTGLVEFAAFAK